MICPTSTPDPCRCDTFDRVGNQIPFRVNATVACSDGLRAAASQSCHRGELGSQRPTSAATGGIFFDLPSRFGLFGLVEVRPETAEVER